MTGTDELTLVVQKQLNIYSIVPNDNLSFSMGNLSENILTNRVQFNDIRRKFQISTLTYTIIFGFICACLCFLTVTGNLLVLITFRRVRTVGNLFILSLATADLIVGCFVMPLAGIYAIMEKWRMGLVVCQIWISVDFIASTASIFNLLTLSLDRYWSITSPLQYLGKRTRTRALFLIGFAWGLSLLWVIPIFGWHHFSKSTTNPIYSEKCEPEYTHSKVFKVTTAILNFYLPLLVLISLNGRIYYEIKRRYKNVLLQRHSTKMSDSITNTNSNSLCNINKLKHTKHAIASPITMTLCDSDRQICSTTINYPEDDSLVLSKTSPKFPVNESILRINFKEKKPRLVMPIQSSEQRKGSLKQTYKFADKNHCTQDELTWFSHQREHSHAPFPPTSPSILSNYSSNRRSFKSKNDYRLSQIYSKKRKLAHNTPYYYSHYQAAFLCHQCSLVDTGKTSCSASSTPPPSSQPSTTMNIFNLCHYCSTATSAITINSNSFVSNNNNNNNNNSAIENFVRKRRMSSSSTSSPAASIRARKAAQPGVSSSLSRTTNSQTSSLMVRSNSPNVAYQTRNTLKQTTVWNQQEKAFRQLFAIVFGFTCCFLPYFILYMVVAFCEKCVSERLLTATVWLGYVNSTINPFLYALSNKHFRRTFNRLIGRGNHRPSFYN